VQTFIVDMTAKLDPRHLAQITASGPPLPALISTLERLRDLRLATPGRAFETAHDKLEVLKRRLRA
jgi:hypothetical protein